MEWGKARKFLSSVCSRDHEGVALARRDVLAGIGLAGLFLAAPKLLSVAEARTITAPGVEPEVSADPTNSKVTEHGAAHERSAADSADVTEVSAQRWRRRYWQRRYWRRRYWHRRYWRRRYWRRRYWRRAWW